MLRCALLYYVCYTIFFKGMLCHIVLFFAMLCRVTYTGERKTRPPRGDIFPGCCCWLVGCLTSQQHASVSQGRICSDNFTCCHTEIELADPTFYLTQSQYTDTGPTSPSTDPITPGACQGSHWSANFEVTGMTRSRQNPGASGIRTRDLPLSRRGFFSGWSHTSDLNNDTPTATCQAPGVIGSAPGLVGLVSVYCDWVR